MVSSRSVEKNLTVELTVEDINSKASVNTNTKVLPVLPPLLFNFIKDVSPVGIVKEVQWNSTLSEDDQDQHWQFELLFDGNPLVTFEVGNTVDGSGSTAAVLQTFNNGDVDIQVTGTVRAPKMRLEALTLAGEGTITINETHSVSNNQIRCQYTRTTLIVISTTTGGSFSISFGGSFSTP